LTSTPVAIKQSLLSGKYVPILPISERDNRRYFDSLPVGSRPRPACVYHVKINHLAHVFRRSRA
jgi:hypothetical protein